MVLLFLGLVMLAVRNLGSASLSIKGHSVRSALKLGTFDHPDCWYFGGLQHPCNLVQAFVLTESNTSEVIEI